MGCGSSKSTSVRDTSKPPDGDVREDVKVLYVQLPFYYGIFYLQSSVFNQSSNISFLLKEEKTELHEDDAEIGTDTDKVKEDITANDNKCHFCRGHFDLQPLVFKYFFYFQRRGGQSYMKIAQKLEQIQKR